jgi:NADPH:quinone reductase-like Zn-dependent oxidoreductase
MCTICGSDVHSYRGRRPNPLPGLLGHEIIGVVEEIGGDGMRDLRGKALAPGDRVTWTEYFGVAPSWERDVLTAARMTDRSAARSKAGGDPPSRDESGLSFEHAEAEQRRTRVVPQSPTIT